jgi:hypothetical protein
MFAFLVLKLVVEMLWTLVEGRLFIVQGGGVVIQASVEDCDIQRHPKKLM